MTAVLSPSLIFQGLGFGGLPLPGGKLFSYIAGTSTPQATYTDSTQNTPNSNPVILNANGQATVWLDPTLTYKFILQDAFGNPVYSTDQVQGPATASTLTTLLTQAFIGAILFPRTPAEVTALVTPVNLWIPSHLAVGVFIPDRYATNTLPGTTDMTTAIKNAVLVAQTYGGGVVQLYDSVYKTTGNIAVPSFVTLKGFGRGNGTGTGGTRLTPVGTFNAVSVKGGASQFAAGASVQSLEIDGSGGCTGNGLDIQFAGLRCYFADLYIHNMTGVGMRISGIPGQANSGSFDHTYERIECRANASVGIQCYELQAPYDGVFAENSFLRFYDVVSVANNLGVELAFNSVSGSFGTGDAVSQATSGAAGIVNYYDVANLRLYMRNVSGTFDTSNSVTGTPSGAIGTPISTTGASSINLVQWDMAGGDNFYLVSVKATEGFVGFDFSRASNMHRIGQQYFDSTSAGVGTAIQVSKPTTGTVQYLTIDEVNSSAGNVGVSILGGQNIFIGTVQMNSSGTPVVVSSGAAGPIFLRTPRTLFTDANVPQVTYPSESIATYTPSFAGSGGAPALGNGTITGETYQHGNKVSLRIQFTFGSTTVMATSFVLLGLPAALGVKGSETQLGNALAIHSGSNVFLSTASLNGTNINIPVTGGSTNWNATTPFTWATGDALVITAEYEVN